MKGHGASKADSLKPLMYHLGLIDSNDGYRVQSRVICSPRVDDALLGLCRRWSHWLGIGAIGLAEMSKGGGSSDSQFPAIATSPLPHARRPRRPLRHRHHHHRHKGTSLTKKRPPPGTTVGPKARPGTAGLRPHINCTRH